MAGLTTQKSACFLRVWYSAPRLSTAQVFGTPVQALRITVHIRIERIQRRADRWCLCRYNNTSRVTSMLEDLEWRIFEQCRINSRLTVLFKFTWGLLSVKSHRLLRPVMRRTRRSHSESFIPR